jgi:hypothetical protein
MDDFKCLACGSPALVYPVVLRAGEPVACAKCGTFVSTYGELKERSERSADSTQRRMISGC